MRIRFHLAPSEYCDIGCAHCLVGSKSPRALPDKMIGPLLEAAYRRGVRHAGVTGGEPLCFPRKVKLIAAKARAIGFKTLTLVSNGAWGREEAAARRTVDALKGSGYDTLNLSFDSFHSKYVGDECYLNIRRAAENAGLQLIIRVTDTPAAIKKDKAAIARLLGSVPVAVQPIEPFGNGRTFAKYYKPVKFEDLPDYHCPGLKNPVASGAGYSYACCVSGVRAGSPIDLGNVYDRSPDKIVDRYFSSLYIGAINTFGMKAVYDAVSADHPSLRAMKFRSLCGFCMFVQGKQEYLDSFEKNLPADAPARIKKFTDKYLLG